MSKPSTRECNCTDEELRQVKALDASEYEQRLLGMETRYIRQLQSAMKTACENVLQARKRKAWYSEVRALGPKARWGSRGPGITAFEYMLRNVARALNIKIPERLSRRERRRSKAALREEVYQERRHEQAMRDAAELDAGGSNSFSVRNRN